MATPVKKEFGPGYDHPNRKFHIWAVILPTVLVATLAVVLMRHTDSASNRVTRSPVVACPTQTCRPAGVADSAKPSQPATQASSSASSNSSPAGTSPSSSPSSSAATGAVVLSSA
jgi:hypothetical protein